MAYNDLKTASSKKSGISVTRPQSGIFAKRKNPLTSYGFMTTQPAKRSSVSFTSSATRLTKAKTGPTLPKSISKSKTSITNNKNSLLRVKSKNRLKKLESPQSSVSAFTLRKEGSARSSATRATTSDCRKSNNKSSKGNSKERKKKKDQKNDLDIVEVYKIQDSYVESDNFSLSQRGEDSAQERGDVSANTKQAKQQSNLKEIFTITPSGHKLCEDFITYIEQIRFDPPDDDGESFREKCLSGIKNLETKINNQLKLQKEQLQTFITKLEAIKSLEIDSINVLEENEKEKLQLNICIEAYKEKLEKSEKRLQRMNELQSTIDQQNKEIYRILNINEALEVHKRGVDMKNEVLLRELSQCEIQISTFKSENEDLKIKNEEVAHQAHNNLYSEEQDAKYKELYAKYEKLEAEHNILFNENKELAESRTQIEKIKISDDENIISLQKKHDDAVKENITLRNLLAEKERILASFEFTKTDDNDIDRLKQEIQQLYVRNNAINHENEELRKQTLRMRVECKSAEETNIMNQRLLKIRGELVKYFHESKDKCSIHDIYPGLSKSNASCESVSLNFNDLQKMSSTLDAKDTDLASKVHMIRYLEDNEDRFKKTISKLKEYNQRLENENNDLKRLLRIDSTLN